MKKVIVILGQALTDDPVILRAKIKEIKERNITVTCSLYSGVTECASGEVIAVRVG